jgi:hypothetical protein
MAFNVRGSGAPPNKLSHDQAGKYFAAAISYVTQSDTAKLVYDRLDALPNKILIECNLTDDDAYAHAYAGAGYIAWDPLSSLKVTDTGWQSPAVGLIHEMYHAYQEFVLKDIYPNIPQKLISGGPAGGGKQPVSKEEIATVIFETKVCQELAALGHTNETVRTTYFRCVGTERVKSPSATGR